LFSELSKLSKEGKGFRDLEIPVPNQKNLDLRVNFGQSSLSRKATLSFFFMEGGGGRGREREGERRDRAAD
jgi:hypothetical protein